MSAWSDEELVYHLQQVNPEAVGVLLEQYTQRLYNYAFYRCGDHHLAEDIVSETFIRIIEKIGGYEQRGVPFRAWVFRIAHNTLANHLRHRYRHGTVSLDAVNEEGERIIDPPSDWGAADGGELGTQIAEREELQQAILTLPEDQKAVFVLRFIEGFELDQVASMLERSIASIKSLQYRAVTNLRRTLEQSKELQNAASDPANKKPAAKKQVR
jgi:RNA polymerase sigma-70 factor, ECF subfamily